MTHWVLRPLTKKNICESIHYGRDDDVIITRVEWFRSGTFVCESDTCPAVDLENPNGFAIFDAGQDWDLCQLDDGAGAEWEFSDEICEQDQTAIREAFEEDGDTALEELGWTFLENDIVIHGRLEIEQDDR